MCNFRIHDCYANFHNHFTKKFFCVENEKIWDGGMKPERPEIYLWLPHFLQLLMKFDRAEENNHLEKSRSNPIESYFTINFKGSSLVVESKDPLAQPSSFKDPFMYCTLNLLTNFYLWNYYRDHYLNYILSI